jgi:hypothetical protein
VTPGVRNHSARERVNKVPSGRERTAATSYCSEAGRHYSPPTSRTRGRDRYTLIRPRPHDGAHPTRVGYVAVAFTPRPEMGSLSTPPLARAAGCSRAHTHTHTPHRVGGHPKACPYVHSFPWSSESASMLARCTTCSLGPSGLVSTSAHCLAPSTKVGSSGRKRRALPCP